LYDENLLYYISFKEVNRMAGCGCGGSSTKPKTAEKAKKKAAPKKK
jgi:hypothetical protein